MLNIAVLGAGRIGQIHARNVARHGSARLAGVTDVNEAAARALSGALGCEPISLDQALAADAVIIGTPTPTHAGFIEQAAAAGKPVFCEKPIDLSAARVRECLAAVERAGIPLMVGFNRRFDPHFAALQAALAQGEIGALEILTILSRDPAPPPPAYVRDSGGIFRDMMIHDLDMARFLMGEDPVEVYAAAAVRVDPAIGEAGDFDTALVTLKTSRGTLCQISNSRRATYGYDQRIEAHGAKGLLRVGNLRQTELERAGRQGFTVEPALPFFLERYDAAYRAELDAFIRMVTAGTPPNPSGADGLKALLLADAATESARTGKPVAVALGA
ncbi:MAG TPA: inositol 2-dehydrogenase [Acetobacteraceae bacterium]|nr:inositol 2-dehydrogenase [Acetobacteraceae bacterium]